MSDTAISVRDLSKRFRIGAKESSADSLLKSIVQSLSAPFRNYKNLKKLTRFDQDDETVFWALKDINFEVKQGEVLGIIGHNGAGKSTLLKILSRITEPTTGEVRLNGRVSSLLEVGTGFHPDLTGRENVFMNGTILGMTKKEIEKKFDEIIDFSGIEKYIDTPIKFYSSGMKVRLGFAVAAHLEPEILIIDEVLAVGDIGFQRKCIGKMNEVAESGRTVIFVSHNMAAVENICTRGILLSKGEIGLDGEIREVVRKYNAAFVDTKSLNSQNLVRSGSGNIKLKNFFITDSKSQVTEFVQSGGSYILNFEYQSLVEKLKGCDFGFSVHEKEDNSLLFILYSSYTGKTYDNLSPTGTVLCEIDKLPLMPGEYLVRVLIMENGIISDSFSQPIYNMIVTEGDFYGTGSKSTRFTREKPKFLYSAKWL